ncbi:hypothetical protein MGL_2958 [Malassezia globosa CBS 7966]|uniref:ER membrane protein complex subunit 4 n=1 Tax=Malassezia globosa (strain ATCC MYA-4612 / CBS 7966) TaxID=425265 RepID=A8Q6G3_MALGO|nr:uncharacterized protein MGL_2958 [Malassezia globosa CBS 7966]EDP42758.1 hypothetical protein MGL_2958 [Malassezia globosa CBS 7966]
MASPLSAWSTHYDMIKPNLLLQSLTKHEGEVTKKESSFETSGIQQSKAWELALSPTKTLPMNFMMMWMSGSGVQIFSMMVVAMMITNPLKGILKTTQVFAPYYSPNHTLLPQMLAFIACHLLCVAMGIYKCWSMGLLPTESSDWLAWYVAPQPTELSASIV